MKIKLLSLLFLITYYTVAKPDKKKNTPQEENIITHKNNASQTDHGFNFHPKIMDYYTTDSTNSQIINEKCFILIYPTDKEIEKAKEENETDYYATAEDNNYWMSELTKMAEHMKIKTIIATKRKLYFISKHNKTCVDLDKTEKGALMDWNLIIFNPNKTPKFSSLIEPNNDYLNRYFNNTSLSLKLKENR